VFDELIRRTALCLKAAGLPYMIIGGQAVLLYGSPRMTKDIDITLGVDIDALSKVVDLVREIGLSILPEEFGDFVRKTFVLPTVDKQTGIRVDFIFSFTPYERQAIARAKIVGLGEVPVMFASLEDVVIHKIFAGRSRDIEDVRTILLKNPDLDTAYVKLWLEEFDRSGEKVGLVKAFEEVMERQSSPGKPP
jgi:predicted nucleotidyltransferase